MVLGGNGNGAVERGYTVFDGQGNGATGSGACLRGATGQGCAGRSATWGSDGTFSGHAAAEWNGESTLFSGNRSAERETDGTWTGTRTVDAEGAQGTYNGASTLESGAYDRNGTYTNNDGQSASVEGTYEVGSGGARTVTCIDASGATVECP